MADPGVVVSQTRVGVNRYTGKLIYGWEHCQQSLSVLITTSFNTRVMRLEFGANVPNLIDRPGNGTTLVAWYVAIDTAVRKWEPGFRCRTFTPSGGPDGHFVLDVDGIFYPRGHLGDYSIAEQRTATVIINSAR